MSDMFYVLYSPSRKQYTNECDEFVSFDEAERYHKKFRLVGLPDDAKWVGPCIEGEEP